MSLDLFKDDVQGTVVAIEAGPIHRLEGQALFEPQPGPGTTHCEPSEKRPLSLYLNKDQTDPQAIGELSLNLMTPGAARTTNTANHVVLTKSCGVGQDEQAMHVRATGLERVVLDYEPIGEEGQVVTAGLWFKAQTVDRAFELLKVDDTSITRAWSNPWPDNATIHLDTTLPWHQALVFIEIQGTGGLDACKLVFWQDCWDFQFQAPFVLAFEVPGATTKVREEGTFRGELTAPDGKLQTLAIREMAGVVFSWAGNVASGGTQKAIVQGRESRLVSEIEYQGAGAWVSQADLDGVAAWSNDGASTSPLFLDGQGTFRIRHSWDRFGSWLTGNDGSIFEAASVWMTSTINDQDAPENVVKRCGASTGGEHELSLRSHGRHYRIPGWIWAGGSCP